MTQGDSPATGSSGFTARREFSIPGVLATQAATAPDKLFLTDIATGRHWTNVRFWQWTAEIAATLHAQGVGRGTHVGVLMDNSAEHLGVFFALARLCAVHVPVNTAARGALLRHYLGHASAEVVVVDEHLVERLHEVLPDLASVRATVVNRSNAAGLVAQAVPGAPLSKAHTDTPMALDTAAMHDLLLLAYTSGTTGPSKASMHSHGSALTYGTGGIEAHGYRSDDVFYVCLPLFHVNALLTSTLTALVAGASVALAQRFSASGFFDAVRSCGATTTNLLGAMTAFLWSQPVRPGDTDHALRLVSMSPLPSDTPAFEARFGLRAVTNYGLSDFGTVTSLTMDAPRSKLGSIGLARSVFEVKIFDDDDYECADGVTGEIVMRAREPWRSATGYFRMTEATAAAHRNQWFHSGDRGRRDADGYLWFVDRKKDCIRRRGENISAYEVEQILQTHPAIDMAAAFPVSTIEGDEEVGVAVVLREGAALDAAALIAHCASHMAYFMVPRYVSFVVALPTTMNQKVEKYKLRAQMQADLGAVWDRERAGIRLVR
ncbi:AMP-binding protein [Hydrogenophaga sp.]|uniref:AMP-binding protein n=1 Tax=Hydrogenophaga sp. TaxID=1904254 RepID=UPI0027263BF1|nr:AMP-binding protein [Hydrogenophaga sp.]MDO9437518.1 AMP-binding protein [Hydrogenophaga sp.]